MKVEHAKNFNEVVNRGHFTWTQFKISWRWWAHGAIVIPRTGTFVAPNSRDWKTQKIIQSWVRKSFLSNENRLWYLRRDNSTRGGARDHHSGDENTSWNPTFWWFLHNSGWVTDHWIILPRLRTWIYVFCKIDVTKLKFMPNLYVLMKKQELIQPTQNFLCSRFANLG